MSDGFAGRLQGVNVAVRPLLLTVPGVPETVNESAIILQLSVA